MTIDTAKERSNLSTCPTCASVARKGRLCATCLGAGSVVRAPRYLAALDAIDAQAAEIERLRGATLSLCENAGAVMNLLDVHGARFVGHLLDTDDNPGQRLRDDISRARAALSEREP